MVLIRRSRAFIERHDKVAAATCLLTGVCATAQRARPGANSNLTVSIM